MKGRRNPPLPLDERFFSKIDRCEEEWYCWEWESTSHHNGYGVFQANGKQVLAHRMAYRLAGKHPIEPEVVMHICDNKKCVNPLHLRGATQQENRADCVRKKRHAIGDRVRGGKPDRDPSTGRFTSVLREIAEED